MFRDKELILFDLDGTLIDSVPDLASAINHTLEILGRELFSEDTIRGWVGNGAEVLVKRALGGATAIDENLDRELVKHSLKIFLDFYSHNLNKKTSLYPNVKETLIYLDKRGYKLAIITNKPYKFVKPILESLDIDRLFVEYIGGDSLDVKKPDPYPLRYMCERLGIDQDRALMVGDSKNDILAANSAGIDSIAVSYGYNYSQSISTYNPTTVVDDFGQIMEVL